MGQDERILLSVAFVALVSLVIAKWKAAVGAAGDNPLDGGFTPVSSLTYNQPAWAYAPPFANIIPSAAKSQLGVALPTVNLGGGGDNWW